MRYRRSLQFVQEILNENSSSESGQEILQMWTWPRRDRDLEENVLRDVVVNPVPHEDPANLLETVRQNEHRGLCHVSHPILEHKPRVFAVPPVGLNPTSKEEVVKAVLRGAITTIDIPCHKET